MVHHRDRITPPPSKSLVDMSGFKEWETQSPQLTSTLGDSKYGPQGKDLVKLNLIPRTFLVGTPLSDEEKVISAKPEYQLKPGERRIVMESRHWFSDLKNLPPNIATKLIQTALGTPSCNMAEFKESNPNGTKSGNPRLRQALTPSRKKWLLKMKNLLLQQKQARGTRAKLLLQVNRHMSFLRRNDKFFHKN